MTGVDALTLPDLDIAEQGLHGPAFHELLARTAEQSWLARLPLGYLVLDREAGEHAAGRRGGPAARADHAPALHGRAA